MHLFPYHSPSLVRAWVHCGRRGIKMSQPTWTKSLTIVVTTMVPSLRRHLLPSWSTCHVSKAVMTLLVLHSWAKRMIKQHALMSRAALRHPFWPFDLALESFGWLWGSLISLLVENVLLGVCWVMRGSKDLTLASKQDRLDAPPYRAPQSHVSRAFSPPCSFRPSLVRRRSPLLPSGGRFRLAAPDCVLSSQIIRGLE